MTTSPVKNMDGALEQGGEKLPKRKRGSATPVLSLQYEPSSDGVRHMYEIGVDEAGRGPLFGRVYAAAVCISPTDDPAIWAGVKDSKRFSSEKRIRVVAEQIRTSALAWAIEWSDEETIDRINILQATQCAFHKAILSVKRQLDDRMSSSAVTPIYHALVDGNYFKPLTYVEPGSSPTFVSIRATTIERGDSLYASIAAASILAKVARDDYIADMCRQYPMLSERYAIDRNKGYGTRAHLDGITQWGITQWHRKSFSRCRPTMHVNEDGYGDGDEDIGNGVQTA